MSTKSGHGKHTTHNTSSTSAECFCEEPSALALRSDAAEAGGCFDGGRPTEPFVRLPDPPCSHNQRQQQGTMHTREYTTTPQQ